MGHWIPGHDGMGAGGSQEILPSPSSPCLIPEVINVSFTIGTHIRDVDVLAALLCAEFRRGSFWFAQNRHISTTMPNVH